jgi:RNA polymerase sigma-70 factor (ECF subfamily)
MASIELEVLDLRLPSARTAADTPALLVARLYERHHRMVRAVCQLILRNPVEAEDAAQQTFLSALGSLVGGTVPRNSAAWLATIARRECWARSAQRQRQPLHLEDYEEAQPESDSALDEAMRNADFAALWTAIDRLPRQQRAAFLLREFSGLSYAEVAEALGVTESAIESLIFRARRQLKDGLEPMLKAANLAATPFVLFRQRIQHFFGVREATEASAGAALVVPAALKVGATIAAAVAVVGGSVDVGRTALSLGTSHAPSADASPTAPVASLASLVGGVPNDAWAAVRMPGLASFPLLLLVGQDPTAVDAPATVDTAAPSTDSIMIPAEGAPATDASAAPADAPPVTTEQPAAAPADPGASAATPAGGDGSASATPTDATPAAADGSTDTTPADDSGSPAATDTTPTDPTPADASPTVPAATEAPVDTVPADTAPATVGP